MRLTLKYDGAPESAKVICAETGQVIDGVRSFTLSREAANLDILGLQILIRNPVAAQGLTVPAISNNGSRHQS